MTFSTCFSTALHSSNSHRKNGAMLGIGTLVFYISFVCCVFLHQGGGWFEERSIWNCINNF